ncbi:unnamed protein product [Cuscuta epithymum]|uniref:Retrotransposon Copia-like N-terminal domain-containing protein n=1 Tax=Cuscuta epithymum TaxID=186058 RepID=A0AAV0FFS4_9ASTE|nr:unnamed protein product [Cuscuta epithymum]
MANDEDDAAGQPPAKIDHNSPYFLGPQDRPGDSITPVRLNGDNYDNWANAIRLALRARRKYGFVDGTITKPKPPCTEDDWITIHSMLVSWILNTISADVKNTMSMYDNAQALWDDLRERFSAVDGPKLHQVKTDLARCTQAKGMSIGMYYAKLKILWDELNNHEPIIECKCGRCTCNVGKQHEKRRADERFHQFLMGLNAEIFGPIRSQLLTQVPLPTLNRAYQHTVQEERVRGMTAGSETPDILGFAVKTDGRAYGRGTKIDKTGLVYSYCKYTGHDVNSCFELKGYPDWWGDRPRADTKNAGRGKGIPKGTGRDKSMAKAHAAVADTILPHEPAACDKTAGTPLPGFSPEQWQALITAFGNPQSSSGRMAGPSIEEADWNG